MSGSKKKIGGGKFSIKKKLDPSAESNEGLSTGAEKEVESFHQASRMQNSSKPLFNQKTKADLPKKTRHQGR